MLSILAEEMTGPMLPAPPEAAGPGEKRKARAAPVQYDLSDIQRGKGTPADPVSFFELAEGATAPVAALSFYQVSTCGGVGRYRRDEVDSLQHPKLQLLTLKTLDIIQISQAVPFGDITITRTVRVVRTVYRYSTTLSIDAIGVCRPTLPRPRQGTRYKSRELIVERSLSM